MSDILTRVRSYPLHTIALLAVVLAAADGFVLMALQGAVGAIERAQGPFSAWSVHVLLMLPIFAVAVFQAFVLARGWWGPGLAAGRKAVAAALLVAAAGTVVGVADIAVSAVTDYRMQTRQIEGSWASHAHTVPGEPVPVPADGCDGLCQAERLTLEVDLRGAALGSAVVLVVNLVIVGWGTALAGGRLDSRVRQLS